MRKILDAHIHLDKYQKEEVELILQDAEGVITVSCDLESCKTNLELANIFSTVYPAFGFHPEQSLVNEKELEALIQWIRRVKDKVIAIGEVGLPYYLRKENKLNTSLDEYVICLNELIKLSKELEKPIVLHAVYEDAQIACDLLERHSVSKAHFHWFKGEPTIVSRLISNGYHISITPDLLYKKRTQELVKVFPLEKIMVETDGPWCFEGPFEGILTRPLMMHQTLDGIAGIKGESLSNVYGQVYENTKRFYSL
jgi:TatD DNase family protein